MWQNFKNKLFSFEASIIVFDSAKLHYIYQGSTRMLQYECSLISKLPGNISVILQGELDPLQSGDLGVLAGGHHLHHLPRPQERLRCHGAQAESAISHRTCRSITYNDW